MRNRRRVGRRGDDGTAAVEFALISIPLLVLVLGIVQFGFIFFSQITITQAAREGARALALNLDTTTPGTCDSACMTSVKKKVEQSVPDNWVVTYDPLQTCEAGATQHAEAVVTVHYELSINALSFIGFPKTTVTGKSSMPCGG